MKKRLLSVLLAGCMVLGSLTAFADEVSVDEMAANSNAEATVVAENSDETVQNTDNSGDEEYALVYEEQKLGVHEDQGWLEETVLNEDGTTTTYAIPSMYRNDYTLEEVKANSSLKENSGDELLGSGEVFTAGSEKDAIAFIRKRGANRDKACEVILNYKMKTLPTAASLVANAFSQEYAKSAKDGDYILANLVSCAYRRDDKNMHYYFEFTWAASAEEEAKLDTKLKAVYGNINYGGRSEYDKIKVIHDYIVNNVTYKKDNTNTCHSAYSAACNGYATSQGYASLFFRMCMDLGVQCRYVTSKSKDVSWNIVKCGSYWYNVDTWADDPSELTCYTYNYFMKCNADVDRPRDDAFNTAAFNQKYPMAQESIDLTKQSVSNVNFTYEFTSVFDDTKYSSSASEGRGKVLIFVNANDDKSRKLVTEIGKTDWVSKSDVYVIDIVQSRKEDVNSFRYNTDPRGYIKFFYDETNAALSAAWAYYSYSVNTNVNNLSYPVIAIVDKNNRLFPSYNGDEATLDNISNQVLLHVSWPFNDQIVKEGNWKFEAVKYVYTNNLMSGTKSYLFSPDTAITRGMVATILYRIEGEPRTDFKQLFADVKDGHYYTYPVCWAVKEKVASGYNDQLFGVNDNVTREQLAKFLYSYAIYRGWDVSEKKSLGQFVDWAEVHSWAWDAMEWATGSGIITGVKYNGYTYCQPKNTATRAECAAMLARFHKKYVNK